MVYYYRSIPEPEIFEKLKEYALNENDSSLQWRISNAVFYITPIINKEFFDLINIIIDKTNIKSINVHVYNYSLRQILVNPEEVKGILEKLEQRENFTFFYNDSDFDSTGLLVNLAIVHNEKWSKSKLEEFITDPIKYACLLRTIIFSAFNVLSIEQNLEAFSLLLNKLFENIKLKSQGSDFPKEEISDGIYMFLLKLKFASEEKQTKSKIFEALSPTINIISTLLQSLDNSELNSNIDLLLETFNEVVSTSNFNDLLYKTSKLSVLIPDIYTKKGFYDFEIVENFINFCDQIYKQYNPQFIEDKYLLIEFENIINNLLETGNPKAINFAWSLDID